MEVIEAILYRSVPESSFWNIEHAREDNPVTGGGQTYVDLPRTFRQPLFRFLGEPFVPGPGGPSIRRVVRTIGAPELAAPLTFSPRYQTGSDDRYRINNQQRHGARSERHPAWTPRLGFPTLPDGAGRSDVGQYMPEGGIHVYIVRVAGDNYYAGFVSGLELPASWPSGIGLESLLGGGAGVLTFRGDLLLDPWSSSRPFLTAVQAQDEDAILRPEDDPPEGLAPRIVPVESSWARTYEAARSGRTQAVRDEAELVLSYASYLEDCGHQVSSHQYLVHRSPFPLRCDLFDETDKVLVEGKGGVSREHVRMAIGQLFDYRRLEATPEDIRMAVLLPREPSADLAALIASVGLTLVYRSHGTFVELPPA